MHFKCISFLKFIKTHAAYIYTSSVCLKQSKYGRFANKNKYGIQPQRYNYFLVLDFESTCLKDKNITPQEIIEFPCIKVNGQNFQIEGQFHHYVKPGVNPTLSTFCTDLTGIMQEMVDHEEYFDEILLQFEKWLKTENLCDTNVKSIFVTSGDWDLKVMLPDQCELSNLCVPTTMKSWIDVKKAFAASTGYFPRSITDMMKRLGLTHIGRLHSAIDDCTNIVIILRALAERGYVFEKTGQIN